MEEGSILKTFGPQHLPESTISKGVRSLKVRP